MGLRTVPADPRRERGRRLPSSAVHGLRWWQVDITALVIRGMERLRLVRNVGSAQPRCDRASAPHRRHLT